jgi:hypothetical protein
MFEGVITKLLEGEFICGAAYPDLFEYLKDESARHEVDGYLFRIGRRLVNTPNAQAYYAAHAKVGQRERAEIRTLFREVKHELKPVLGFLNLVMQTTNADKTLLAGDVIDFPTLLMKISENQHLGEALRAFAALGNEYRSNDPTQRAMLEKVLQQITKAGYLIPDRERDHYQVTGKIDYFYQVMDFLAENEENIEDDTEKEPEGETGRLI